MKQLLNTPQGVRDYYGVEQDSKKAIAGRLSTTFRLYGYSDVQTPTFEYFDIFNAQRGSLHSRQMYKFFDTDGETLVLRPDFTPSIARCAAKYFDYDRIPIRLCYSGNTFVNHTVLQGLLKESTQAGVELIGENSPQADAEIIALTIDCLLSCGLEEFQIELGHVDFFRGLAMEAGLYPQELERLVGLLQNKNNFAVQDFLSGIKIPKKAGEALCELCNLFGQPDEIFKRASGYILNDTMRRSIERLEQICSLLEAYGKSGYISADLGIMGSRLYYTGLVFKGYTYGTGNCVATGGRYDDLMGQFGHQAPSVGMGIPVDTLIAAMQRQDIPMPVSKTDILLVYGGDNSAKAAQTASKLRAEGKSVLLFLSDGIDEGFISDYAKKNNVTEILAI